MEAMRWKSNICCFIIYIYVYMYMYIYV